MTRITDERLREIVEHEGHVTLTRPERHALAREVVELRAKLGEKLGLFLGAPTPQEAGALPSEVEAAWEAAVAASSNRAVLQYAGGFDAPKHEQRERETHATLRTTITTALAAARREGWLAGREAAAQWHDGEAGAQGFSPLSTFSQHVRYAERIRSLPSPPAGAPTPQEAGALPNDPTFWTAIRANDEAHIELGRIERWSEPGMDGVRRLIAAQRKARFASAALERVIATALAAARRAARREGIEAAAQVVDNSVFKIGLIYAENIAANIRSLPSPPAGGGDE